MTNNVTFMKPSATYLIKCCKYTDASRKNIWSQRFRLKTKVYPGNLNRGLWLHGGYLEDGLPLSKWLLKGCTNHLDVGDVGDS